MPERFKDPKVKGSFDRIAGFSPRGTEDRYPNARNSTQANELSSANLHAWYDDAKAICEHFAKISLELRAADVNKLRYFRGKIDDFNECIIMVSSQNSC